MTARTIGFIGLGNMGCSMAANLIASGLDVVVHDRDGSRRADPRVAGARWGATPREVAELASVTFTSLPGPPEVEAVALGPDGVLAGASAGDVYVDMSTSTPPNIRAIAAVAAERGVGVLDAPIAGGMRGARNGTLTIMVGGDADTYALCKPYFEVIGEQIFHVGDVGAGHVAKLVNNMMSIANAVIAMEAMVVGVKAGVDAQKLLDVAEAGTGGSFALNLFRYVILDGKFEPAKFALSLAAKDLRVSVEYAEELGVPLTVMPSAYSALAQAMEEGLGGQDWSSAITLLEKVAGVEVRRSTNGSPVGPRAGA